MVAGAPDAGFYLQDCEARRGQPAQTRGAQTLDWVPRERMGGNVGTNGSNLIDSLRIRDCFQQDAGPPAEK